MDRIRLARPRDATAAARLAQDAYRPFVARIGRRPAPMDADYRHAVDAATMWVIEDDERLVGFVVLIEHDDHLLVDNVAVAPGAQGRGVGARLLRFAEEEATRRGLRRVRLHTNEAMTENLAYYPRRGYVETHRGEQHGYRRVYFTKELG